MKLFRMAAVLAVLVAPAYAQEGTPHVNLWADGPSKTDDEKAADAAREKAYKETLKKIPDSKTSSDPWGGMRTEAPKSSAPKASAATAPKKSKAGTAAN
jgi:hypothetical protein